MPMTAQQKKDLITALTDSARAVLRTRRIVGGVRIVAHGSDQPDEPLLSVDVDALCAEIARNGAQHVSWMLEERSL